MIMINNSLITKKSRGWSTIELIFNLVLHVFALSILLALINACQSHIKAYREIYNLGTITRAQYQLSNVQQPFTEALCIEIADDYLSTTLINTEGKEVQVGLANIKGFNIGSLECEVDTINSFFTLSYITNHQQVFSKLFGSDLFTVTSTLIYN